MTADVPPPSLAHGSAQPPSRVHDVALLDLDGVLYVGPDAVPGAAAALEQARGAGMRLGFVTNNAARTPQEVAAHLSELGMAADPDDVITSSQAAATVVVDLVGRGAGVLPVGGPGVASALTEAGLRVVHRAEDDPVAVVQGYGRDVGWTQLAEAVVAVRGGARHVATNTDATIPSPRGVLPGNGALVGVVAAVTGQQPLVAGKPAPAMHRECVRRTGAQRPVVVGDRLDTDVEGGRRVGVPTLLVLSGVTTPGTLLAAGPEARPDLVAHDVAGLCHAHPAVEPDADGWRCGAWTATVDDDAVLLSAGDGPPADDLADDLDGLRALCVAHWAAHPDESAAATVRAAEGAAPAVAEALARWGLDGS
ncbi:Haloacid Dehalogenase Superfamily Class (subfamily) IIA [Klenkia marina]|uniref:Haloacid Dehalogenase Superfamily Class (Subfamily) IIA n=1 Tax=Klenkia marina TaxID=1960309 RepID=A0A1G4YKK7_9ACTN|nr:HAD-IIA family hydrolase [Klenkia marina]SCX54030.1 Haloacid Dehalogenase Superfamily Class (subfamily) IIA [Klenkia marina]